MDDGILIQAADENGTRQFHPWPSIVCPQCECGLSVRLPEGFKSPMPPVIVSTNSHLSHILDVARWEYECGGCSTHVTVYAECAVDKPAAAEAASDKLDAAGGFLPSSLEERLAEARAAKGA